MDSMTAGCRLAVAPGLENPGKVSGPARYLATAPRQRPGDRRRAGRVVAPAPAQAARVGTTWGITLNFSTMGRLMTRAAQFAIEQGRRRGVNRVRARAYKTFWQTVRDELFGGEPEHIASDGRENRVVLLASVRRNLDTSL